MACRGPSKFKKVVVGIVGFTVLFIGVALLVLPGPAFVVIPAGLAILATEFVWARRWLKKIKAMVTRQPYQEDASSSCQQGQDRADFKKPEDTRPVSKPSFVDQ